MKDGDIDRERALVANFVFLSLDDALDLQPTLQLLDVTHDPRDCSKQWLPFMTSSTFDSFVMINLGDRTVVEVTLKPAGALTVLQRHSSLLTFLQHHEDSSRQRQSHDVSHSQTNRKQQLADDFHDAQVRMRSEND